MDPQDDPEARIRELERPLGATAGPSELGTAKRGTSAGVRARTILNWMVAIGVLALAIGKVAVFIAQHSGGGGSIRSAPSAPPSSTVTSASQPVQTLYRLLPKGYSAQNCSPVSSPNKQALATLQCGQASDPHGPASAAFSLYPKASALATAFQNGIDEDTVTPCPGGKPSPGTWATDEAPNVNAGAVLCGKYDNGPDLMWTNDHDLLLSDIQGPDLGALYAFWSNL